MAFIDGRKVWRISPGKGHFQWRRGTWQSQKVISIGWEEIGDLRQYTTVDEIKTTAKSLNVKKPGYAADQLWTFKQVKKGHFAIAYGHYTILDIGIVTGPYFLKLDDFVHPSYDLYGHRIPVTWLKLGPLPFKDKDIQRYLSQNNTIFQITDPATLRFIQELLSRSFQYRVESKVTKEIGQDGPEISFDFDEETLVREIEENSTFFKNNFHEIIDISKELEKLKLQNPPDRIQTKSKIRVRVVSTSSASADLDRKTLNGLEIYVPHGTEKDPALKAVSRIFDVMVWGRNIPPCYFEWIRNNLSKRIWQLRVVPFKPIACNSRIENNGIVDVEYYECGFQVPVKGDSMGGFNHKQIAKGDHENLHQVIHCLHKSGIDFRKIQIEQRFDHYVVDILGEVDKDKKYIAVELGKISELGKFLLVDEENVKELWFGDTNRFIYSLSRKAPNNEQLLREEADSYFLHIIKYYKDHCDAHGQLSSCLSSYSAYNCVETIRYWENRRLSNGI